MVYLVTYQFRPWAPGRKAQLERAIASTYEWAHGIDNTWLIRSQENAQAIYNRLAPFLTTSDYIMVVRITRQADYQGWLPEELWTWLQEALAQEPWR